MRLASAAGLSIPRDLAERLEVYLSLLGRWNRRINLTGLEVDPPDAEAIDRLIIEPLAAARFLPPGDLVALDIGSGGGSPALPLQAAAPQLRFVLIEATARKVAFLREAIRVMGLSGVDVEACRFENFSASEEEHERVDLVTLRAVRLEKALVRGIWQVLRPDGNLFWFDTREAIEKSRLIVVDEVHRLVPERNAHLGRAWRGKLVI
jgi:16S rRNA (guanine(527)-N(7))-methyltransferase RsmG